MKSPTAYKDERPGDTLKHKGFPGEPHIFAHKKNRPRRTGGDFLNWLGN